jgi:magnesium transporter
VLITSSGEGNGEGSIEEYFRTSIWRILMSRLPWLLGLLVLQSLSALILHSADKLIEQHIVIAMFLPMIVGTVPLCCFCK